MDKHQDMRWVQHNEQTQVGLVVIAPQGDDDPGDVYLSTAHEVTRRGDATRAVVVVRGVQYRLMDLLQRANVL